MNSIANIEIFRAGTWNGDKYTVEDLDDMVANFDLVGYNVPVKLGHSDDPGEPAYGWVAGIRRVGDRLLATLTDIPSQIFDAIANRRFDAVSAEIIWNLKRNGQTFRRALAAIALLGSELPAVAGLKPLRDAFRGLVAEAGDIHVYTFEESDMQQKFTPKFSINGEPGAEVDRLVRRYCWEHHDATYESAMTAVLADPANAELKHAYAALG
jgi:hypothetical protein